MLPSQILLILSFLAMLLYFEVVPFTKDGDTKCSFIFNDPNGTLDNPGVHIYFEGNIAVSAGNELYGGYTCILLQLYTNTKL